MVLHLVCCYSSISFVVLISFFILLPTYLFSYFLCFLFLFFSFLFSYFPALLQFTPKLNFPHFFVYHPSFCSLHLFFLFVLLFCYSFNLVKSAFSSFYISSFLFLPFLLLFDLLPNVIFFIFCLSSLFLLSPPFFPLCITILLLF